MAITLPENARGPILDLALPASSFAVSLTLRNVTTGKTLTLNLPGPWAGDDLTLDFRRRTIRDQNGNDRSALLDPLDNSLWSSGSVAVLGANDIRIEARTSIVVSQDSFEQTAGAALTGKNAPVGGLWSGAGDTDDFKLDSGGGHFASRTVSADADLNTGRYLTTATPAALAVLDAQATIRATGAGGAEDVGPNCQIGVLLHYTDVNNWVMAFRSGGIGTSTKSRISLEKRKAGTRKVLGLKEVSVPLTEPMVVAATIDAAGNYALYMDAVGAQRGGAMGSGKDTDLATGGTLASGKVGIYGATTLATTPTLIVDDYVVRDLGPQAYGATANLRWEKGYY